MSNEEILKVLLSEVRTAPMHWVLSSVMENPKSTEQYMRLVKTTQETPTLSAGPASGRVARPSLLCTFPTGTLDKYT
jgi:hypothetical protein